MQRDRGLSLDSQRNLLSEECARRGWELVELATDVGSGRSTQRRPALNDALGRLDRREADVLLSTHLARMSRSVIDFANMVERARKRGWRLVVLDIDVDTTSPHGELISNILASFAQWERKMLGMRVKEGIAERRRQGLPFGQAPLVSRRIERRITRMSARGMCCAAIAARLTNDGEPTPRGKMKPWCRWSVAAILKRLEKASGPDHLWTPSEIEKLRSLAAANAPTRMIALELGRSAKAVQHKR